MKRIVILLIIWTAALQATTQLVPTSACVTVTPSDPSVLIAASQAVTLTANPTPAGFAYLWYDSNGTTQLSTAQTYLTASLSARKTRLNIFKLTLKL